MADVACPVKYPSFRWGDGWVWREVLVCVAGGAGAGAGAAGEGKGYAGNSPRTRRKSRMFNSGMPSTVNWLPSILVNNCAPGPSIR